MKFKFVLMTKGKRKKSYFDKKTFSTNEVEWNVPYYSKVKEVHAPDEDVARFEIRKMLKSKWTGFRLLK